MTGLCFRPAAELWPLVDRAFQRHSREIRVLVPSATVEHVGATSVPGLLTKGDLDLLVRVPPGEVDAAVEALQRRYPGLVDESDPQLPVGIEVVAEGSDRAHRVLELRRRFRGDPVLVARANDLRRQFAGGDAGEYEVAKQALYASVL